MIPSFKPAKAGSGGFTLLEVMIALTITGLALGALFSVIAGSKRLAWRSADALAESVQARRVLNLAQLDNQRGELEGLSENGPYTLSNDIELEEPERKTEASTHTLRGYEILTRSGDIILSGTYWVELARPE